MLEHNPDLFAAIRARFAHVDACPLSGPRIFFENAGGTLTLNKVAETSAFHAAIPDNQGRANESARALDRIIATARQDMAAFFGTSSGQIFVGESGTELLFRLIRNALTARPGPILGSTVEHPASRSAAAHWAEALGRDYITVPHDPALGIVTPDAYAGAVTPDLAVATILHTSPVTGMAMDVAGIARTIRGIAPEALIIVDGIQHACHGAIHIDSYGVDGYVISPYKVFSRHGYGVAWASDRLTALPHERLRGSAPHNWEFGTRDTGAYATMTDVVAYLDWLGSEVSDAPDRPGRLRRAGEAIHAQEKTLTDTLLHGTGNLPGLTALPGVHIVGGADNPAREGLVCFWADGHSSADIVDDLNAQGIRTHIRKNDHYSGNILGPLGQDHCVRVSVCHYNSVAEITRLLSALTRRLSD